MKVVIIGSGRAGTSFASALSVVGHVVELRHHDALEIPSATDVVLLCVPDDALVEISNKLIVSDETVVAHCAGSRTLDVLRGHDRVGSLHPLVALPDSEIGAKRLVGATYCVTGDAVVHELVWSLGGRTIELNDARRAAYHATACVAANHLVTLMGHVARLAQHAGLELADFLPLAHGALSDVGDLGTAAALTGPASRGDLATIDAHLAAIPESERSTYVALANAALTLADRANASPHA